MARQRVPFFLLVQRHVQALCLLALIGLTLGALGLTLGSAMGWTGWLELEARFGDLVIPEAGQYAQIGITALLVGLCFFLPSHGRIMRLELAHRDFTLTMEDVCRAYYAAHAADRAGAFTLQSEFDSVRERILHLREHPDLSNLEHEVLELAAQMSHQARELAEIYSETGVDRARLFLKQRMEEVESTRSRIETALVTCREIRRFLEQVEMEESVVESRLSMLREELDDIMPRLHDGPTPADPRPDGTVPLRAAAE